MRVLVTGGAGYIGSHTVVELIRHGHEVVIVDNLSNSNESVIERLEYITKQSLTFYQTDVRDTRQMNDIFKYEAIEAVMHFAGLKAVGESVEQPLSYYRNNLDSTLALCEVMQEHGVNNLIFSSSATVYGTPKHLPINETQPTGIGITNPYGQTKFMIEQILNDLVIANQDLRVSLLRYFNPIGAHESGMIGEEPTGIPNNLMPYIAQVANGERAELKVFGNDYHTPDGTGIRDYIHVVDLAKGHVAALEHINKQINHIEAYNLGTGRGTSVMELVNSFVSTTAINIPYSVTDRRPGDVPACYADVTKANRELDWRAEKTLEQACIDTWRAKFTLSQEPARPTPVKA